MQQRDTAVHERDKTSTQINIKVKIAKTMRLNKNFNNNKCKFLLVTIAVCLELVQFKTLVGRSGYVGDSRDPATVAAGAAWHLAQEPANLGHFNTMVLDGKDGNDDEYHTQHFRG